MPRIRAALFRGRHFEDEIIVLCLRWYLRYSLSYRDLEEMMAERGLSLDHSTIARWVLRYAPILSRRIRGEMRKPNRSWRSRRSNPRSLHAVCDRSHKSTARWSADPSSHCRLVTFGP